MALLSKVPRGADSCFSSQCSGFPGAVPGAARAVEHHLGTCWKGEFPAPPRPPESGRRVGGGGRGVVVVSYKGFWCTALVQGWKSIPNTQITLSTVLASFCHVSKNMWARYQMLYLQYALCVWFEHTHARRTNPGIDFCTGLCLFYRICFGMALRLLFSLLGNKCDLEGKVPNLH